jgi:hypothetical protein
MQGLLNPLSQEDKMTQPLNLGNCCGPSIPGIRKITLPDGDQVGLIGLDAVLEALYEEGKQPDSSTAREMIGRLREKNYISSSSTVEELYEKALLTEYQRFYQKKIASIRRRDLFK